MTVPCGTGFLKGITLQHPLRDVDDDHDLIGRNRQSDTVGTVTDVDLYDHTTSCRDGTGRAVNAVSTRSDCPSNGNSTRILIRDKFYKCM